MRDIQIIFLHQFFQSQTFALLYAAQPFSHQDPVLILKTHHIPHCGDGGKLDHLFPLPERDPCFLIQNLNQFICHHGAADLLPGISTVLLFWIDDGCRQRQHILSILSRYIVVVGDNHCQTQFSGSLHLVYGRNPVIAGEDGIHTVCCRRLDNLFIDPVPVLYPVRNLIVRRGSHPVQRLKQEIGRADAVDIIISHDPDLFSFMDLLYKNIGRFLHIF